MFERGAASGESELQKGTTFSVRIPMGKSHLLAERIDTASSLQALVVAARLYVEEALRWLPESTSVVG